MAKSKSSTSESKVMDDKEPVEPVDTDDVEPYGVAEYKKPSYNKVRLQSQISARIKLTGKVSGKLYIWQRAGTVVEVDEEDADDLLLRRLGEKPCCGGSINYLFIKIN